MICTFLPEPIVPQKRICEHCLDAVADGRPWLGTQRRELDKLNGRASPAIVAVWFAWWYLRPTITAGRR
ncbi:hypothetical protein D0Q02_30880 [Micromonospora craniellae]|uniref:Uncharacterized protein n=1 Tax=Micromonospora craniellae TaxID=2294034 RepID=A0A372FQ66_9ACTN|nr:hypothetical protein D0Q02_30880 [Micromonospora craniellae]